MLHLTQETVFQCNVHIAEHEEAFKYVDFVKEKLPNHLYKNVLEYSRWKTYEEFNLCLERAYYLDNIYSMLSGLIESNVIEMGMIDQSDFSLFEMNLIRRIMEDNDWTLGKEPFSPLVALINNDSFIEEYEVPISALEYERELNLHTDRKDKKRSFAGQRMPLSEEMLFPQEAVIDPASGILDLFALYSVIRKAFLISREAGQLRTSDLDSEFQF